MLDYVIQWIAVDNNLRFNGLKKKKKNKNIRLPNRCRNNSTYIPFYTCWYHFRKSFRHCLYYLIKDYNRWVTRGIL